MITKGRPEVSLQVFSAAFPNLSPAFAKRMFRSLTEEGFSVPIDRLASFVVALDRGSVSERIALFYALINSDGSGVLTYHQLADLLRASCSDSDIALTREAVDKLTTALFRKAGKSRRDGLSLDDFTRVLQARATAMLPCIAVCCMCKHGNMHALQAWASVLLCYTGRARRSWARHCRWPG